MPAYGWLWHRDQLRQLSEVLGGDSEKELVLGTTTARFSATARLVASAGSDRDPHRALTAGVGLDKARSDREALAADQPFVEGALHATFEQAAQPIAALEAIVTHGTAAKTICGEFILAPGVSPKNLAATKANNPVDYRHQYGCQLQLTSRSTSKHFYSRGAIGQHWPPATPPSAIATDVDRPGAGLRPKS
ncbi:hypothetical protein [Sandarakinorhabdus glacialis]|uniref:hypothetical protein n=1 Tax=Sandarakinorhabdus glacialis TaxID=1614636 RepID=UPI0016633E19|nr:hypothetical protein [Polymorphobacter glacialis]